MKRVLLVAMSVLVFAVSLSEAVGVRPIADGYEIILTPNEQVILLRSYGGLTPASQHVGASILNFLDNLASKHRKSDQAALCERWKNLSVDHRSSVSTLLGLPTNPCPETK
jgi:hypothetical protein